jgi:preprotein translocase subunit SecE
MDPTRLVVIFSLVFGIILALFFDRVLEMVWAAAGWRNPEILEGLGWSRTGLLGAVLAAGLVAFAWVNATVRDLAKDVANEMMKVTWPTFAETRVATVAVVVASLVAAVILFGIDTLSYKVMVDWIPHLWGKL